MQKVIRPATFESNSSSSHSLTIGSDYDKPKINYNGEDFILEGGEFGWGYEKYSDTMTKINYVAVEIIDTGNEKLKHIFEKVLRETYNCGNIIYDFGDGYDGKNYSYIDHQSRGLIADEIDTESKLERFLFSKQSQLIIDNDNH